MLQTLDAEPVAVQVTGIDHHFGAVHALKDITIGPQPGEIHASVDEYGAGKSTLLGVLAGRLTPLSGSIEVLGIPLQLGNPRGSRERGIVAIYQDLTMIPSRSAFDNVFLGQLVDSHGWLNDSQMRSRFGELCTEMSVAIDPDSRVDRLSVADHLAAFAGLLAASTLGVGQADLGSTIPLDAIAAVVIGGTSPFGGEGAIWRTAVGLLILAAITNLFQSLALDSNRQAIAKRAIVIAAVGLDAWLVKRRRT